MNISEAFKSMGDQHLEEQNLLSKGLATIKDYVDLKRFERNTEHFRKCGSAITDNREFALKAVTHEGALFQSASDRLKDDKEILLLAIANDDNWTSNIQSDGSPLKYASKRLQADKETVLAALEQRPRALEYASTELKNDKEVVLAAIGHERFHDDYSHQREILKHASLEIQDIAGTTQSRANLKKAIECEKLSNKLDQKLDHKLTIKNEAPTKKMKI